MRQHPVVGNTNVLLQGSPGFVQPVPGAMNSSVGSTWEPEGPTAMRRRRTIPVTRQRIFTGRPMWIGVLPSTYAHRESPGVAEPWISVPREILFAGETGAQFVGP